jgi:hypothetical protein
MKIKSLIFMFITTLLCTCVDPYNIRFNKFDTLLVVDALLTDEDNGCYVKLSRSDEAQDAEPGMVSGAIVNIIDENGTAFLLHETADGIYKTDTPGLKGNIGVSYTLSVITPEGDEYESEPCRMLPVDEIENIYYDKDQEILENGTEIQEGIRIFLDSKTSDESKYLRWMYTECWNIMVPDPKRYDYINDSTILPVTTVKQKCWGSNTSDGIIIQSAPSGMTIEKKPIIFIDSDKSNRFLIRYSIEIKQLSLSRNEYEFWDQMKQINEIGGDIFEKQPFPVVSNIHNVNNPDEPVLGYFQVSAVSSKRIYIDAKEISDLSLPRYNYDCSRIVLGPDDYPPPLSPGAAMTFDKIYKLYAGPAYSFVEPVYDLQGVLRKLAFSKVACSDCTITGDFIKPDFWID